MSGEKDWLELRLTPHGVVTALPYPGNQRWAVGVGSRFAEHEAAGLVSLAAASVPSQGQGGAPAMFWRDIGAEFLRALCHVSETAVLTRDAIEPPGPAVLAEWVLNAPPMKGGEYLTPNVLGNLWQRLLEWTVEQADDTPGNGTLGKDALLEFHMSLALGDQQLSAAEVEELLNSAEGLVLLRGEWVEVDRTNKASRIHTNQKS